MQRAPVCQDGRHVYTLAWLGSRSQCACATARDHSRDSALSRPFRSLSRCDSRRVRSSLLFSSSVCRSLLFVRLFVSPFVRSFVRYIYLLPSSRGPFFLCFKFLSLFPFTSPSCPLVITVSPNEASPFLFSFLARTNGDESNAQVFISISWLTSFYGIKALPSCTKPFTKHNEHHTIYNIRK